MQTDLCTVGEEARAVMDPVQRSPRRVAHSKKKITVFYDTLDKARVRRVGLNQPSRAGSTVRAILQSEQGQGLPGAGNAASLDVEDGNCRFIR